MHSAISTEDTNGAHPEEPHSGSVSQRLNWLRAGVLGANDGIVSTAGVVIGVASATPNNIAAIATAGFAALVAGAFSMAGGEYVSVSTQRDTEKALIEKERQELIDYPEEELQELADMYQARGLSSEVAHRVAVELTEHDALAAHAEIELGIDPHDLTSPWMAAISSFVAFSVGALVPLAMILLPLADFRITIAVVAVILALTATGVISAALGGAPKLRAVLRNITIGSLTMAASFGIGALFGLALA